VSGNFGAIRSRVDRDSAILDSSLGPAAKQPDWIAGLAPVRLGSDFEGILLLCSRNRNDGEGDGSSAKRSGFLRRALSVLAIEPGVLRGCDRDLRTVEGEPNMPLPPKPQKQNPSKRRNRPKVKGGAKSAEAPSKIAAGDIFAYIAPDGRFGAVRVLAVKGTLSLVLHTPYFEPRRPWRQDPLLLEGLARSRFDFGGAPATVWLDGKPGPDQPRVAFVELTEAELALAQSEAAQRSSRQGFRTLYPEVHAEWRWAHDRAAFERDTARDAEVREKEHRQKAKPPQRPNDPMSDRSFWKLIDLHEWSHSDEETITAKVVASLAMGSARRVVQFAETLAHKLYLLDTRAHAEQIGRAAWKGDKEQFSSDGFLFARCMVVAKGEAHFRRVLEDPSQMPKDATFEALLDVSSVAWELITGDAPDWTTGCDYETYNNATGW
jgi:Protein of unknown function (DUF4240)